MTPVDIGDTQGTLQAKKTFETLYKHPETLVWVYRCVPAQGVEQNDRQVQKYYLAQTLFVGGKYFGKIPYAFLLQIEKSKFSTFPVPENRFYILNSNVIFESHY